MTVASAFLWLALALLALPILRRVGWLAVRVLFAAFLLSAVLLLCAHETRLALGPVIGAAVCLLAMRWRGVWRLVRGRRPVRRAA